jgi:hypothetical protein
MPFTVKVSNAFSHFHKVPYRSDIFVVIHQICFSELPSLAIRMFFKYSSCYFQIRYLRLYSWLKMYFTSPLETHGNIKVNHSESYF